MSTLDQRYVESLERAREANLERTIRQMAGEGEHRKATPQQISHRSEKLLRQVGDPVAAGMRLERILQGNELTDVNYLGQGAMCARSVCRIAIKGNGRLLGYGTGFLVAPGVLMTNHHVLENISLVGESLAQFRYERDLKGNDLEPVQFALRTDPQPIIFRDLDMALVAVEPRSYNGEPLDQFGWLELNPQPGKAIIGEYLTIIQHPGGERKQVCVRENKLLDYSGNGPYLWYQTDTSGGSSGAAVFNNSWEVVALHHSSVPKTRKIGGKVVYIAKNDQRWTPDMGDDQIQWIANEGIRISRIFDYLQSQHAHHPLTRTVLSAGEPPTIETSLHGGDDFGTIRVQSDSSGKTRILVPIEIDVNLGLSEQRVRSSGPETPVPQLPAAAVRTIEKVVVNQDNYDKRNGFNPRFLGAGRTVPLPKVRSNRFGKPLKVKGKRTELKYWNYSVVMNTDRSLAYFSAANIDSDSFRGKRDADGDKWFFDTRFSEENQTGGEFYGEQKEFEASRVRNPFDRGHLTRRSDLQWGNTNKEAKRNGDDSFHWTNCSPQHWQFNQNKKASGLWFRLEQHAIEKLGEGQKLCVINGPVFDAPLTRTGADGLPRLNLKGKRSKDGTFGDLRIPKQFFKVIAYQSNGELRAKAFVVSQEELLMTIDRLHPAERKAAVLTDLEVRLYQVKIRDLEKLTNLDFGSLVDHDVPKGEESLAMSQGLPVEDEGEISF